MQDDNVLTLPLTRSFEVIVVLSIGMFIDNTSMIIANFRIIEDGKFITPCILYKQPVTVFTYLRANGSFLTMNLTSRPGHDLEINYRHSVKCTTIKSNLPYLDSNIRAPHSTGQLSTNLVVGSFHVKSTQHER